ncbi:MAG: Lipoprotein signal peptidase [candidate division TM6 bacterium GW2011_GWF2_32_72]|nr:MAG: Lipoprotein signal peptidase [candidate division TM6 bacterium GW2011_GWF2_32_72]
MKKNNIFCVAMFLVTIFADRITKLWSINMGYYKVNSIFSFDLVMNRGVSWGMFHYSDTTAFVLVSLFVLLVTLGVGFLAYTKWRDGESILGESLIIAGSFSNLLDRIIYGGVVDFIVINIGNWNWPAFNIADTAIVVGVATILLLSFKSSK